VAVLLLLGPGGKRAHSALAFTFVPSSDQPPPQQQQREW